jgi:hypothetical protein
VGPENSGVKQNGDITLNVLPQHGKETMRLVTDAHKYIPQLLSHMKTYVETLDEQISEAHVQNEWKMAARIIDRLLLVMSCVLMFMSTVIFLSLLAVGENHDDTMN